MKLLKYYSWAEIRNKVFLESVFHEAKINNKQIKVVIHLTVLKSIKESILSPINYLDGNLNGTINLLNVMDKYSFRKMIFCTSSQDL